MILALALSGTDWITIGGTILTLVVLEGLLSADNALVLAVMVRHLPRDQQRKALRYGIIGAFVFRFIAVVLAATILNYWQFEVVGGIYLLQLAIRHLIAGDHEHHPEDEAPETNPGPEPRPERPSGELTGLSPEPPDDFDTARKRTGFRKPKRGFWATVVGVELADIAFSIDSILAAVAMANGLPDHIRTQHLVFFPLETWIIYIGGVLGIITMRYVAGYFLLLLDRFKGLTIGAYLLVGWIGLKLIGQGFYHALHRHGERLVDGWRGQVPDWVARNLEMPALVFWGVMVAILVLSMVLSPKTVSSPAPAAK